MSYTSRQAAQESQRVDSSANKVVSPKFSDQRASTSAQLKQQQMMHASDANPLQRAEDEELLQGKFATAQLAEEEELLQGKFETAQLAEEEELLQGKFSNTATAQLEEKPNNTGLPNQLKAGIESLSGISMDGVKVHYNSDKPAQLNAHAYAQGSDIHVAPGQEQHLPHEAWHVVQQAQGRVQPTTQMKGTSVNDDMGLESEADMMGAKALKAGENDQQTITQNIQFAAMSTPIAQLRRITFVEDSAKHHYSDGWGALYGIQTDQQLKQFVWDNGSDSLGDRTYDMGRFTHPEEGERPCTVGWNHRQGTGGDTIKSIRHCGPSDL